MNASTRPYYACSESGTLIIISISLLTVSLDTNRRCRYLTKLSAGTLQVHVLSLLETGYKTAETLLLGFRIGISIAQMVSTAATRYTRYASAKLCPGSATPSH